MQAGVLNTLDWFSKELGVNADSKVLGLTTFCFDISVLEIFLPLTNGATLFLLPSSAQKNPYRIVEYIIKSKITLVQATPTTFEMLLSTGWKGDISIDFLVGGEAFRPSILPIAQNAKSLRNVYGPTETTIWSSSFLLPRNFLEESVEMTSKNQFSIPIGSPISGTEFYITDPLTGDLLTGIGCEGELIIGGVGVALGYHNSPALTKEKFFRNPFRGSGFVYKTGDLVKRSKQNEYTFITRLDSQIKLKGYRIELSGIESVYSRAPQVL